MATVKRLLGWLDRPGIPGWMVFGPDGRPLAWAPTERIARWFTRRIWYAHDHARPGDGWLADGWTEVEV